MGAAGTAYQRRHVQRDAAAVHQPAEDVAALIVGAEQSITKGLVLRKSACIS